MAYTPYGWQNPYYARKQCRKTGEYLADTRTIGYMCPLKFIEKQEETNNESI